MKVVINRCWGGFRLSNEAMARYIEEKGLPYKLEKNEKYNYDYFVNEEGDYFHCNDIERNDPILIQIVEEMGEKSWDRHAELKVVEVPDDVKWYIHEYDGMEHVAEEHQIWS